MTLSETDEIVGDRGFYSQPMITFYRRSIILQVTDDATAVSDATAINDPMMTADPMATSMIRKGNGEDPIVEHDDKV